MHASQAAYNLIKDSEGLFLHPYHDPVGLLTIGYGHKIVDGDGIHADDMISPATALQILVDDVSAVEHSVSRMVTVPLTQGQFDALVDFAYNLGIGRLAGSTLLKLINAGKLDTAGPELLKWDHAGGKVLPGLKARREAEYKLWTGGAA